MEEGERNFGIWNSIKNLHKKCLNNDLIGEFDLFSIPVKLNLNGNDEYKTVFGGIMHIILIIVCLTLTYFVMYADGLILKSEIVQIKINSDYGDTGQTVFDNTDQIFGINGQLKATQTTVNISDYVTCSAYQVINDGYGGETTTELEVSTECSHGREFCLRKSALN